MRDPGPCCLELVATYEAIPGADVAKARGGIALYCAACKARVICVNGTWQREGP